MINERRYEMLSAFYDGEMTGADREAVECGIRNSPESTKLLADFRTISRLLHELPEEEIDAKFRAHVIERCRKGSLAESEMTTDEMVRRRGFPRVLGRRLFVAALIVAAVCVLVPFLPSPKQGEFETVAKLEDAGERKLALPSAVANERTPSLQLGFVKDRGSTERLPIRKSIAAETSNSKAGAVGVRFAADPLVPPIPVGQIASGVTTDDQTGLTIVDDLKQLTAADIGRVVTAFEQNGDRVTVVKLTVVDCHVGVDALQVLLSRNAIQRQPDAFDADDARADAEQSRPLVAVLVRASARQFAAAIEELGTDDRFRSLAVASSAPVELLKSKHAVGRQRIANQHFVRVSEFATISRQLRLSFEADSLHRHVASDETLRTIGGPKGRKAGKTSAAAQPAGKALTVLFVLDTNGP